MSNARDIGCYNSNAEKAAIEKVSDKKFCDYGRRSKHLLGIHQKYRCGWLVEFGAGRNSACSTLKIGLSRCCGCLNSEDQTFSLGTFGVPRPADCQEGITENAKEYQPVSS